MLGLRTETQEPVPKVDGIRASWSGGARELQGNLLDHVPRDLDWDGLRKGAVGLEGSTIGICEVGSRISHEGMFAPQYVEDRPSGLRAFVVRLQDSSLVAARQGANGGPDAATEDLGIVRPGLGFLVSGGVRAMSVLQFRLRIVD